MDDKKTNYLQEAFESVVDIFKERVDFVETIFEMVRDTPSIYLTDNPHDILKKIREQETEITLHLNNKHAKVDDEEKHSALIEINFNQNDRKTPYIKITNEDQKETSQQSIPYALRSLAIQYADTKNEHFLNKGIYHHKEDGGDKYCFGVFSRVHRDYNRVQHEDGYKQIDTNKRIMEIGTNQFYFYRVETEELKPFIATFLAAWSFATDPRSVMNHVPLKSDHILLPNQSEPNQLGSWRIETNSTRKKLSYLSKD